MPVHPEKVARGQVQGQAHAMKRPSIDLQRIEEWAEVST